MLIRSLSLRNFRNFDSIDVKFNENLNIFIGNNGQGKTNIIEAIYLLAHGESFRFSKNENLIQLGHNQSFIKSEIINEDLDYKVNLSLSVKKKDFFINGKPSSFNKIKKISAVLFSPESISIIKDSSDKRRLLVDQFIEQVIPVGSKIIYEYKKILKTRNKILKDISEQKIEKKIGLDTLEALNEFFLNSATELTIQRINLLNAIKPEIEKALINIQNEETVKFDFRYIISEQNHKESDYSNIKDALHQRMKELALAELSSGISLVGPQKHDIAFLYNGNDSRFYCSQGQQRSIILAYKMAQIVYHHRVNGFYPLLLLDDVLSELDLLKQDSLISNLNQTETQTFVTTTDISLLSKLSVNKAKVFKLVNGQIVV